MSAFDLVFGLLTIISSLALTHLLTTFVSLLRSWKRVQFSVSHALWAWSAFASTIANWASYWEFRTLTTWPAWMVLLTVATAVLQYVFCAFVSPDIPAEGKIDLIAFHEREQRRYVLAMIALYVFLLVLSLAVGGANYYAEGLRDSVFSIVIVALAVLELFVSARRAQIFSAGAVAALLTGYLIVTTRLTG